MVRKNSKEDCAENEALSGRNPFEDLNVDDVRRMSAEEIKRYLLIHQRTRSLMANLNDPTPLEELRSLPYDELLARATNLAENMFPEEETKEELRENDQERSDASSNGVAGLPEAIMVPPSQVFVSGGDEEEPQDLEMENLSLYSGQLVYTDSFW